MINRKRLFGWIGVILGLILLWLASGSLSADKWLYRTEFRQSHQLIEAVEQFQLEQGRLPTEPESVEIKINLGLPADEQCPCYRVEDDNRFIVWFGYQTTGSSMVYESQTAEWAPRY